ncbi:hypothetical protein ECV0102_30950 [Enterobacter cloacae]|nr:hypothetical protein ECV0102_30950 [Enterobacter cloacae]
MFERGGVPGANISTLSAIIKAKNKTTDIALYLLLMTLFVFPTNNNTIITRYTCQKLEASSGIRS